MARPDKPISVRELTARETERLSILLAGSSRVAVNVYADGAVIVAFDDSSSAVMIPGGPAASDTGGS
jgi:hypothetical protein